MIHVFVEAGKNIRNVVGSKYPNAQSRAQQRHAADAGRDI